MASVQNATSPFRYFASALASEPIFRKKSYPSGGPCSNFGYGNLVVGPGRGLPKLAMKLKQCGRNRTPLWWKSSPTNQSLIGACGLAALSAGWASIIPGDHMEPGTGV